MDKIPADERKASVERVDRPSVDRPALVERGVNCLFAAAVVAIAATVCYVAAGRALQWGVFSIFTVRELVEVCGPARGVRAFLENLDYQETGVFVGETDGFVPPIECVSKCPAKVSSADARRIGSQAVASWGGVEVSTSPPWVDLGTAAQFLERDYRFSVSPRILALDPPPCLYKVTVFGQCVHPTPAASATTAALVPYNPADCCRFPGQYVFALVDANSGEVLGLSCMVQAKPIPLPRISATPSPASRAPTRLPTARPQPTATRPEWRYWATSAP